MTPIQLAYLSLSLSLIPLYHSTKDISIIIRITLYYANAIDVHPLLYTNLLPKPSHFVEQDIITKVISFGRCINMMFTILLTIDPP